MIQPEGKWSRCESEEIEILDKYGLPIITKYPQMPKVKPPLNNKCDKE